MIFQNGEIISRIKDEKLDAILKKEVLNALKEGSLVQKHLNLMI